MYINLKINKMKKILWGLTFVMLALQSPAQTFQWEVKLNKPDTTGFHKIFLQPEITSKLNPNYSDIRIFDQKNNEIPYIKRMDKKVEQKSKRYPFKIIENKHRKRKGYTQVVIQNTKQHTVTNISISIKNTDIEKWIQLKGSNDKKNWYIIKDLFPVQSRISTAKTSEILLLDFPLSNYKYYEILLHDFNNQSIKVVNAGYYKIAEKNLGYVEVAQPKFIQNDTMKRNKSIVDIVFPQPQYIDKIVFNIASPDYYLRKASLTKRDTAAEKKLKVEYHDAVEKSFFLNSKNQNAVHLSNVKVKHLRLTIDNKDNAPLKFYSIKAYQLRTYLVAKLQENKEYFLRFGSDHVKSPVYDLKYFTASIPDSLPLIKTGRIFNMDDAKLDKGGIWKVPPGFLWITLGIIVVFLAYMSFRMFREVKRFTPEDEPE